MIEKSIIEEILAIYKSLPQETLQDKGDGWVNLANMGSPLKKANISYKKYGYEKLAKFIGDLHIFEIEVDKSGTLPVVYIRRLNNDNVITFNNRQKSLTRHSFSNSKLNSIEALYSLPEVGTYYKKLIKDAEIGWPEIVGFYEINKEEQYKISDVRDNLFHEHKYPAISENDTEREIVISLNGPLYTLKPNRYYRFNWKVSLANNERGYVIDVDRSKPAKRIDPMDLINNLHKLWDDRAHGTAMNSAMETISSELMASSDGTFIYELLQNANDYPIKDKNDKVVPVEVEFRLTDKYLICRHSGAQFTPRDVAGICSIGSGSKIKNKNAIGYKGIGFKTVFHAHDWVYIKTGDFTFRFDKNQEKDGRPFQIMPIWTTVSELEKFDSTIPNLIEEGLSKFNVQIVMQPRKLDYLYGMDKNQESEKSHEYVLRDIFKDIRDIVFIPNIKSVKVFFPGEEPIICTKGELANWIVSDAFKHELDEETERFIIIKECNEHPERRIPPKYKTFTDTYVSFAAKKRGNIIEPVEKATVYCYLPTKAEFGFPFLMNTDMVPSGDRNQLKTDVKFNLLFAKIAGEKFFFWLQLLMESNEYELDSVFSLIPDFDECKKRHSAYDSFIDEFQQEFEKHILQKKFVPIKGNDEPYSLTAKIIYDTTGISSSDIMSDEELLTFANGANWTTNNDEYFPHPDLRDKPFFSVFIGKYHANNMVFGEEQLLEMCSKSDFIEWLQIQENNNRFLTFLLDHKYLSDFIKQKKEIFIGENGNLYSASSMYYNIDEQLENLSYFADDYLPHLSYATREYFRENANWNETIKNEFLVFDADKFVSDVLANNDMKSLLRNKDNSVSFIQFLTTNQIDCKGLLDLPFYNVNDEIVSDFNRLVFFESNRGYEVKKEEWLDDAWMDFISKDYYDKNKEKCLEYLKNRFHVLEYSDKEIINSIIKENDNLSKINESLDDIKTAAPFIDFVRINVNEFKDGELTAFDVIVIDRNGNSLVGPAYKNSFIYSDKYEEIIQKKWLSDNWIYSLSDSYFVGKSEGEKEELVSVFCRLFGLRKFENGIFFNEIIPDNLGDLVNNLFDVESNIDFWRWIKINCQGNISVLKGLPIIASDTEGKEHYYIISENSIYMSDDLLPDGQYIESIVKKYYDSPLFVIPKYAESLTAASKKEWRKFFENLGVMSEQTELVFDQIIPNLSEIEDPGVPSMIAQAKDYFKERNVSISDLLSLRLQKRDGEYEQICNCLFISTKKINEPFKYLLLDNECDISQYSAETRALILDIAKEAGATIVENVEDWRFEKIAKYLSMQDNGKISNDIHLRFVKDILEIDDKERKVYIDSIRKIKLLAKDNKYYDQKQLTLGKEYHPLCDFESNGITDKELTYLAANYSKFDCENLGRKIRDTFDIHYRFEDNDINLLSNFTFADFFWRRFIPHKNAPVGTIKTMIEEGKFNGKKCVPIPCGIVDYPENLYSRKELREYMKLVSDWSKCYPFDDYPNTSYEVLDMLPFKETLSFEDGMNALMFTEDQTKRYFLLKWMADDYDEHDIEKNKRITEYREDEKSRWRNRSLKKCFLRDLYALDIDEKADAKYLEQYFKAHPKIILDDYFSKATEIFYKECKMLQLPCIKWEDMIFAPELSDINDNQLKNKLRNYLLFVAAIEKPDNWLEYYNSLCEQFDKLSFQRCIRISLTYKYNKEISQTAKKFYHDSDKNIFYYVGKWNDLLVFTDFIDELRNVVGSEMDRDLFMQVFVPKQSINEFENFANENCKDLAGDENFRNIIQKQLGVRIAKSEYEENDEEPELLKPIISNLDFYVVDESETEMQNDNTDEDSETDDRSDPSSDIQIETSNDSNPELITPNLGEPTDIILKTDIVNTERDTARGEEYLHVNRHNDYEQVEEDKSLDGSANYDIHPNNVEPKNFVPVTFNHKSSEATSYVKNTNKSDYDPDRNEYMDSNDKDKDFQYLGDRPYKPFTHRHPKNSTKEETERMRSHGIPLELESLPETQEEIDLLAKCNIKPEQIADTNYLAQLRLYLNLKNEQHEEPVETMEEFVKNAKDVTEHQLKDGRCVHACSAARGVMYIGPTVWNKMLNGTYRICVYLDGKGKNFEWIDTTEKFLQLVEKDDVVLKITGKEKVKVVNALYTGLLENVKGTAYTLIRVASHTNMDAVFAHYVGAMAEAKDGNIDTNEYGD